MTLAAILLTGILWIVPSGSDGTGATAALAPQTFPIAQDQTSPSQTPTSSQATPSQPGSRSTKSKAPRPQPRTKKPVSKKKPLNSGCDTPAANSTSSASSTQADTTDTAGAPAQKPTTPSPTNCPPEKIIVRHGGTTEPSIQLAGGPGGNQASQTRDATTQMLGSTEANLKTLAGQQLSTDQKDNVTQIREFMQQSRGALVAGDNDRAYTLAKKAKLLSEDLVNPQK